MKKRLVLRPYVLPTLYIIMIIGLIMFTSKILYKDTTPQENDLEYVSDTIFEKGVVKKVSTRTFASSKSKLPDRAITFASLSFLVRRASITVFTLAHLTPFTLLHAIDIPIPDPHIAIPKSYKWSRIFSPNRKAYLV